jgi:ABC-type cobalt transport system substrate-binding protein
MAKIVSAIIKLALLALVIVLGIVFVPDSFMKQVNQKVTVATDFARAEVSKRTPGLQEEFNRKVKETKGDIENLYQSLKEKYSGTVMGWASSFFGPKGK